MFFTYTCYLNELWTIDVHFPNSHIMAMVHSTLAITLRELPPKLSLRLKEILLIKHKNVHMLYSSYLLVLSLTFLSAVSDETQNCVSASV